jgi:hypothetical protein
MHYYWRMEWFASDEEYTLNTGRMHKAHSPAQRGPLADEAAVMDIDKPGFYTTLGPDRMT